MVPEPVVSTYRRLLAVVVAGSAVAVAGCGQPRSQPAAPAAITSTVAPSEPTTELAEDPPGGDHPGPTAVVDGVPRGFSPDRGGALAAGLSFTRLNQELVEMSVPAAEAARRAMATEDAADALAADVRARLGDIRARWPRGSLRYRVAPLAVRATEAGPGAMDVDVWYVGVVAGSDLAPYEEWGTESYRLVWEGDDWRVAALSDTPGPRPDPGYQSPSSPPELEARLDGFEAVS
jgi:hypothetical protein